jgi:hypothetical protein
MIRFASESFDLRKLRRRRDFRAGRKGPIKNVRLKISSVMSFVIVCRIIPQAERAVGPFPRVPLIDHAEKEASGTHAAGKSKSRARARAIVRLPRDTDADFPAGTSARALGGQKAVKSRGMISPSAV